MDLDGCCEYSEARRHSLECFGRSCDHASPPVTCSELREEQVCQARRENHENSWKFMKIMENHDFPTKHNTVLSYPTHLGMDRGISRTIDTFVCFISSYGPYVFGISYLGIPNTIISSNSIAIRFTSPFVIELSSEFIKNRHSDPIYAPQASATVIAQLSWYSIL